MPATESRRPAAPGGSAGGTSALLRGAEDLVPLGGGVIQRLLGALLLLHDVLHLGGHDLVHLHGVGHAEERRARIGQLHLLGESLKQLLFLEPGLLGDVAPRGIVPVVAPAGSVAMSYLRLGLSCFWIAMPHGPSNIIATLPAAKFARFSFSPLERTPGTAILS